MTGWSFGLGPKSCRRILISWISVNFYINQLSMNKCSTTTTTRSHDVRIRHQIAGFGKPFKIINNKIPSRRYFKRCLPISPPLSPNTSAPHPATYPLSLSLVHAKRSRYPSYPLSSNQSNPFRTYMLVFTISELWLLWLTLLCPLFKKLHKRWVYKRTNLLDKLNDGNMVGRGVIITMMITITWRA